MKGYIYKYTFPDDKVYIGQTRRPVEIRHREHISLSAGPSNPGFWKAFNKFKDCKLEVIETIQKETEMELINALNVTESFYISKYDATNPKHGYNKRASGSTMCRDKVFLDNEFNEIWTHIAEQVYPTFYFIYDKIENERSNDLNQNEIEFIKTHLLTNNIHSEVLREWLNDKNYTIIAENEQQREEGLFWLEEAIEFAECVIRNDYEKIICCYIDENAVEIINKRKPVKIFQQYNTNGQLIKEYKSKESLLQEFNIIRIDNIMNAVKGKQKTAYGFIWKIVEK